MTGNELYDVKQWLVKKANRREEPTSKIVEVLDKGIMDDILNVRADASPQTIGDYVLGGQKIHLIKALRAVFGWGLGESKNFLDNNWDRWISVLSRTI